MRTPSSTLLFTMRMNDAFGGATSFGGSLTLRTSIVCTAGSDTSESEYTVKLSASSELRAACRGPPGSLGSRARPRTSAAGAALGVARPRAEAACQCRSASAARISAPFLSSASPQGLPDPPWLDADTWNHVAPGRKAAPSASASRALLAVERHSRQRHSRGGGASPSAPAGPRG